MTSCDVYTIIRPWIDGGASYEEWDAAWKRVEQALAVSEPEVRQVLREVAKLPSPWRIAYYRNDRNRPQMACDWCFVKIEFHTASPYGEAASPNEYPEHPATNCLWPRALADTDTARTG